jgi:TonB-linked SusC/RagA family outer membrane protein
MQMKKQKTKLCLKAIMVLMVLLLSFQTFAQTNEIVVKGKVHSDSINLVGASIVLKGNSKKATTTDESGKFLIKVPANGTLIVSSVGYTSEEVEINGNSNLDIIIKPVDTKLGEVVVVGYGTQRKTTVVSSVVSLNTKDIKGPTSNLTTMLAGKIAGMVSFQRSGEPGQDNAQFFIRGVGTFGAGKVDPLILIDGIESSTTDLARLQPDDIAGFSVLKDATATAVYGARGANGVILLTTKVGQVNKMKFNFRIENSTSFNTQNIALADNISFMTFADEAVLTRNPLGSLPYSQTKIDHTIRGDDPLIYPNNNWIDQLIKPYTNNQRANLNISGGAEKAKYYIGLSYNLDNGNLRSNSLNGFNNNIKLQSYSILSNVTLNFTKTTEALVSLKGQFDNYNGPIGGAASTYYNALYSNPVAFPAVYSQSMMPWAKHPLFGNAVVPGNTSALYTNPYAVSLSGFQSYHTSTMTAQLSLKQKFDFITTGLSARIMAYIARYSNFSNTRQVSPYYYGSNVVDGKLSSIYLINDGSNGNPFPVPTEYLNYSSGNSILNSTSYGEASLNYNRIFNEKHAVGGMLIGIIRNYLTGNASDLQGSLPSRNEGVSGRFTYGYDNRYLLEFDFGYNGTERFAANHRFGFFPSVGGGWIVSNEKFFEPFIKAVNNLKFRFTYGLVGNDQIGNSNDRFFYLSNVGLNGNWYGAFGTNFTYSRPTDYTTRYANADITWEKSKQFNIGMDISFLHDFKLTTDVYHQKRTNILMMRSTIPSTMGLQATPAANVGQASSKGIDLALDYNRTFNKNLWLLGRATFTYATSKVLVNEEPIYDANNINLSRVGNSVNQLYGLVAERLFIDQVEVNNSPMQFGNVMAGDIKYRDINGDGKISTNDYVPIGYPTVPEINYGAGFTIGYKSFDFSLFFQGVGRTSFMISSYNITPFVNQNGLLKTIADSHWSENDRNSYAFWPRLNNNYSENNNYSSTWWLRNGAFMRLKSTELGYNMKSSLAKRWHLNTVRLYLNGTNLLTFSSFKLWDSEMGSSGLGYPIQRVVNIGALIGL